MNKRCKNFANLLPPSSCTDIGARREMQERKTHRDMKKEGGAGMKGDQGFSLVGCGGIAGSRQSTLEQYNFWSYTPDGEKDMIMMIMMMMKKVMTIHSKLC